MKAAKPYHHGNLKDALLEAALALIARGGPRSFTLREVARRAGVSHNAPYRHFRDKQELLAAVAAQGFAHLTKAMNQAARDGETALERWKLCGQGYLTFALRWPQHFAVMFDEAVEPGTHADCDRAGEAAFATLLAHVTWAQREGGLAAGDPMPAALTSWAVVHGLARLAIDKRLPMPRSQAIDFYRTFVAGAMLDGLAKSPRAIQNGMLKTALDGS